MRGAAAAAIVVQLLGCDTPTAPSQGWVPRDAGFGTANIIGGAFGSDCFVFVADAGRASRSCDGAETWAPVEPQVGAANLRAIAYGDGAFVAVGAGGHVTVSRDGGATWSARVTHPVTTLRGVAYGAGAWVAAGDGGVVLRSIDLVTWTQVAAGGPRWISVLHTPAGFLVSGGEERFLSSPNGLAWAERTLGWHTTTKGCELSTTCNDVDDVTWTGTRYVAVTHPAHQVFTSTDLGTWTSSGALPFPSVGGGFWVTHAAAGVTMAGGTAGMLGRSIDEGRSWEATAAGFGAGVIAIAHGEGTWVVAGMNGELRTWSDAR